MVVSLYVQSFMNKFSLRLIFFSLFFDIAMLMAHYCKLKCISIDNQIVDMCTNFTTLSQFTI